MTTLLLVLVAVWLLGAIMHYDTMIILGMLGGFRHTRWFWPSVILWPLHQLYEHVITGIGVLLKGINKVLDFIGGFVPDDLD